MNGITGCMMVNDRLTVSIHQPNFIPWVGYFHKIALSDVFIFFDDVQYPLGKSFVNRVLIKMNNGAGWINVPVKNKSEKRRINEVEINNSLPWKGKLTRTIGLVYKNSPYADWLFPELREVLNGEYLRIAELNVALIKFLCGKAGITTEFLMSGEMEGSGDSPERRIPILVQQIGGTVYLSGSGEGSKRYLNESNFAEAGIALEYQKFVHPVYPQLHGDFVANLSFIDLLFNCGPKSIDVLVSNGSNDIIGHS